MPGAKDRDDGTTRAMIFEGASISQLVQAFGMDARDVSKKLRNVAPCGTRRGFPIYKLKDAAQALIPPRVREDDIIEYIASMNFKNLPPALNKEVWNGLRARLRFEQEQGDLWRTDAVQSVIGKIMQLTRMFFLLMPDEVARAEEVSPKMHERLRAYADSRLADLQQQIIGAMRELDPVNPGIMDFTNGPTGEDEDYGDLLGEEDGVPEAVEEDEEL